MFSAAHLDHQKGGFGAKFEMYECHIAIMGMDGGGGGGDVCSIIRRVCIFLL